MKTYPSHCHFVAIMLLSVLCSCLNEQDCSMMQEGNLSQGQKEIRVSSSQAATLAARFAGRQTRSGDFSLESSEYTMQALSDESGNDVAYVLNIDDFGWVIIGASRNFHPVLAYNDTPGQRFEYIPGANGLSLWMEDIKASVNRSFKEMPSDSVEIALEWNNLEGTEPLAGPGIPGGNSPEAVLCRNRIKELNDKYYHTEGWVFQALSTVYNPKIPQYVYNQADAVGSPYEYTIIGLKREYRKEKVEPLIGTTWHQQRGFNMMCPLDNPDQWGFYPVGCVPLAMGQIMYFHQYPESFDWNSMTPASSHAATQFLLAHIGKTIGAWYQTGLTQATAEDAIYGFKKYGYTANIKPYNEEELISELKAGRPAFMAGNISPNSSAGHAWVCEGVNWDVDKYDFYAEYQVGGRYDTLGSPNKTFPEEIRYRYTKCFYMNWGLKDQAPGKGANGWYADAVFNGQNYSYNKIIIYTCPDK